MELDFIFGKPSICNNPKKIRKYGNFYCNLLVYIGLIWFLVATNARRKMIQITYRKRPQIHVYMTKGNGITHIRDRRTINCFGDIYFLFFTWNESMENHRVLPQIHIYMNKGNGITHIRKGTIINCFGDIYFVYLLT